jgi:hypothetical protein
VVAHHRPRGRAARTSWPSACRTGTRRKRPERRRWKIEYSIAEAFTAEREQIRRPAINEAAKYLVDEAWSAPVSAALVEFADLLKGDQ